MLLYSLIILTYLNKLLTLTFNEYCEAYTKQQKTNQKINSFTITYSDHVSSIGFKIFANVLVIYKLSITKYTR